MQKIASFQVNHDVLTPGMYVSRVDGDVVTYDIRMKTPNAGDYLENAAMHTIEHLFATYARNSKHTDSVVYVGPMGCRTGFYLLVRDDMSNAEALALTRESFAFIAAFDGPIPGAAASAECGNYLEHDLAGAKREAAQMVGVLRDWEDMTYKA
jgi:S-ribosylhomocysteine lyase